MGVVMDFRKRQRDKRMDFERRALQDITYEKIEGTVHRFFDLFLEAVPTGGDIAVEMCAEYALEAFLLGSAMGRFGYYGERTEAVFERCRIPFETLWSDFCDFWQFWAADEQVLRALPGLQQTCASYLHLWWEEGFDLSLKRWKMKLYN